MSQQPQTIVVHHIGQSALGTAGLIFSCIGWLTCGLLCIPGAFFSFFGLFSKKQKGHAIAGLIVGFPGVLFFMFMGATIILPMLGLGALIGSGAIDQARQAAQRVQQEQQQRQAAELSSTVEPSAIEASAETPTPIASTDSVPLDDASPASSNLDQAIAAPVAMPAAAPTITPPEPSTPEPASRLHTFVDITGKHQVIAELIAVKNNWVKLKREDGKEISMPISKLSEADQQWVKDNPPQ